MTAAHKLWLAALSATAVTLTACPSTPGMDGGTGGGGNTMSCLDSSDCPDSTFFRCDPDTQRCEPGCRSAAQCNTRPSEYTLDFCQGGLGCQCDEGRCVASLCSADSDCGSQVCRNGACVDAPAASTVSKCVVTPDFVVLAAGSKASFYVSSWDAQNNPVVVKEGATWSSLNAAATGSGTGVTAEFTAGTAAATTAVEAVQAAFGSVNCKAKVIVVTPPATGKVKVSVVDELSGRPVSGATVVVSQENGTIIAQGAAEFVTTDAAGTAEADLTGAPAKYSVTVFHADFSYLTVANYAGSSRFLSFALRRNAVDKFGGFKGTFNNVPATDNIHAALSGMSLAGSITNLNVVQLLGPSVLTDVQIGEAIKRDDVPIPAGVYLGFQTGAGSVIKGNVAGQGLNGTCSDEAKVLAGTCGTRAAWGLAGDVGLNELPVDQVLGGLNNLDISGLLAKIVPLFRKFNSTVVRDVEFSMVATPRLDGGEPDFTNQNHFTTTNLEFAGAATVPLGFNFVVSLPELPKYKNVFVDGAAIIGGASYPGRGVVPLGLGAGVNTAMPIDGQIDRLMPLQAGQVGVRMAPTHHGLEGGHYGLVVAAISARALTDNTAGLGASALFPRLPGNKLPFDPEGATPVNLAGQKFPAYAEGARFNYTDAQDGSVPGRSFRSSAVGETTVLRVSFSDSFERRWDVLVDATAPGFTLPNIPAGTVLTDRLFDNGSKATGGRSGLTVQGFRLAAKPLESVTPALTFNQYVELNDTNGDRTTELLTAFSFLTYPKPSITWVTPKDPGMTIAKGSKLQLTIGGFGIGTGATDEGVVQIAFTGGTGCTPGVAAETTKGSGSVELTLPAACSGTVTITATLLKVDGVTSIAPPVSKSITATIE